MEKSAKKELSELLSDQTPDLERVVGYDADEMLVCTNCGRKCPPNRDICLYCGHKFEGIEVFEKTQNNEIRKPELWEPGYNLVAKPMENRVDEASFGKIARITGQSEAFVRSVVQSNEALPVLRIDSEQSALRISELLLEAGFETFVVSDIELDLKNSPQRLRKIEFADDFVTFTLFNGDSTVKIPCADLVLIIAGSIFERTTERTEKYVKSKENKTISLDQADRHEKIFDIYAKNERLGYRVFTHGFDFSGLKSEMSFLAFENLEKIKTKLVKLGVNALFDQTYDNNRGILGSVWEVEETVDSRGLTKKGVADFNLTKTASVTNLSQFTRYSRLKRAFL